MWWFTLFANHLLGGFYFCSIHWTEFVKILCFPLFTIKVVFRYCIILSYYLLDMYNYFGYSDIAVESVTVF